MTSTTDHSGNGEQNANNPKAKSGPRKHFNAAARSVHEVEIKELVQDNDRSVFDKIERFFEDSGYIRLSAKNRQLQTRQLDTINRDMLKQGKTLRIRGTCEDSDLNKVQSADICLKDEKTTTASGAVKRNEYEARIRSFETATLRPLLEKYSKEDHPDLHKTLHAIRVRDLREHFRIDCIRNRFVVELPEEVTGIKGKKFFAELILDDVAFMMDLPGRKEPLVFHHDLEVECEVLFKPCSYDTNPEAAKAFVSSQNLTKDEVDMGLRAIKALLKQSSGDRLIYNTDSKAERGFRELDETLAGIREYLSANERKPGHIAPSSVTSAYSVVRRGANDNAQTAPDAAVNGNIAVPAAEPIPTPEEAADFGSRLHKHLPRSMAHVVRERPIARRPML